MSTIQLPLLKAEIDRPLQTLLSVVMIAVIVSSLFTMTACPITQSDLQTAQKIIQEVVVALPVALQLVGSFGAVIPANVQSQIQIWSNQALGAVQLAQTLLAQYSATAASTIGQQIQAALATAQSNLSQILVALHVVDQKTQLAVGAAFSAIVGAVGSVIAVVSALIQKPAGARVKVVKVKMAMTAKSFKGQFNNACAAAGHPELHI